MYVTIFPFDTSTGSFGCVYVAEVAVPSFRCDTSTCGILLAICVSFTAVMNFLNAKSNSTIETFSKSSSSSCPGT